MNYFEEIDGSLIFRENGETVMITPWGKNSLRVRSCILGEIPEGDEALLEVCEAKAERTSCERGIATESTVLSTDAFHKTEKAANNSKTEIHIEENHAFIRNGSIEARITSQPIINNWENSLQITFYNKEGTVLLQEISNGGALIRKARYFKALQGGNYKLKASFVSEPEEKIYGMGQYQQEKMNLKGCNLELAHRNSQASVPFYVSSLGYGFLWNNPAIGEVNFGLNTTQWVAESTKKLDYWITAGDTPAEILEAYGKATGTAPMMPEYGLGFWQCKLRYYNQEQVLNIAREYKKRDIPLDVLVIDFYHWPKCGDWRFDEEFFPAPGEMVQELKEMGIEPMVSFWPQVEWNSENYAEMKQQGLLVKSNGGIDVQMDMHGSNVFMDATNPRTRKYVWEKCKKNYADYGIKSFWLDEAEPEFTTYDYDLYRYHAGSVAEKGNIYPREFARLFYEGQKSNGQDEIVNLIRCAWAGSQRYGALVWSGDIMSSYEDFRKQICAGIHMGLSGIPWWTTDIGGFHGGVTEDPDFRELLVRWFQFGAFCPVMRIHGHREPLQLVFDKNGVEREGTGADNEVWSFGEEAYPILVKFIRIRELMRDYTRVMMKEAHEKGAPVMRALFFEFPEDQKCWDITDSYMFGSDILVAPVCHEHEMSREVYLPEGAFWINAHTGERCEGGQILLVDAPLETLPVFLRDGRQSYLTGEI